MKDPKQVIAESIQEALINDDITWRDDSTERSFAKFSEVTRMEVQRVTGLNTQIKVWPAGGGAPRYFNVRVSEGL